MKKLLILLFLFLFSFSANALERVFTDDELSKMTPYTTNDVEASESSFFAETDLTSGGHETRKQYNKFSNFDNFNDSDFFYKVSDVLKLENSLNKKPEEQLLEEPPTLALSFLVIFLIIFAFSFLCFIYYRLNNPKYVFSDDIKSISAFIESYNQALLRIKVLQAKKKLIEEEKEELEALEKAYGIQKVYLDAFLEIAKDLESQFSQEV